jgi:uncharacterized membrane protein
VSDQKTSYKKKNSRKAALTGLAIAGTGVSHFTSPALFEGVTKSAFPRDTRRHVYTNGGIETALGLGFSARKTRPLAIVGLIGYGAYLAGNALRNR